MKSTVEQIRERFDNDVERFSNLDTGQSATMDAPLALDLITRAAVVVSPDARAVLDVGCGAGNYTLKLLQNLPGLDCILLDLSRPMLGRARERVSAATTGRVETLQGDIRDVDLGESRFDIILAAAVLHHLRTDDEWRAVFSKFHRALRPGGSLWVSDYVNHAIAGVQDVMWERFGEYLTAFKSEDYRDHVFAYIEEEDTPRPLTFQLELLRDAGFTRMDVLHKNSCFSAFCAVKGAHGG